MFENGWAEFIFRVNFKESCIKLDTKISKTKKQSNTNLNIGKHVVNIFFIVFEIIKIG